MGADLVGASPACPLLAKSGPSAQAAGTTALGRKADIRAAPHPASRGPKEPLPQSQSRTGRGINRLLPSLRRAPPPRQNEAHRGRSRETPPKFHVNSWNTTFRGLLGCLQISVSDRNRLFIPKNPSNTIHYFSKRPVFRSCFVERWQTLAVTDLALSWERYGWLRWWHQVDGWFGSIWGIGVKNRDVLIRDLHAARIGGSNLDRG